MFDPLHVAFRQVCTGHVPQLTVWPQLFVTLPHLPAQVVAWGFGVQQAPLALQTWPLGQHTPLQHWVVQLVPGDPLV